VSQSTGMNAAFCIPFDPKVWDYLRRMVG